MIEKEETMGVKEHKEIYLKQILIRIIPKDKVVQEVDIEEEEAIVEVDMV